jgi:hypothetical protein
MINFIFPDYDYNFSKYNLNYNTFTKENPHDPWTLEWLLYQSNITFTKSITPKTDNDYVLFNLAGPGDYRDFQNVPDKIWDYINQHDNVNLILYHGIEATSRSVYQKPWNNLEIILQEKNILPNKVFYITGDIIAPLKYKQSNSDYFSKINVLGLDVFEMMHMHRHFRASGFNFLESIEQYCSQKKEKKFLNLNNIMRPHRRALLFYLKKNNLLDEGFVSSLEWRSNGMDNVCKNTFNFHYNFDDSDYEDFLKINDTIITLDSLGNQASDKELYINSYYSLVTETQTSKDLLFITEKTYKPILMGHPFMILGCPNSLSYLKNNGYYTFPELFDESYDSCLMEKDRLKIIIDNLKRDVVITDAIYEKLKHNQRLFLKQPTLHTNKHSLMQFLVK